MANELIQTLTNNLDYSLEAVTDALSADLNRARFLQNTISVIKANPDLMKCNQTELLTCALQGAYLGLDFMNKECWIVPYGGHAQFQIGYKGACKYVKKYSIRPLLDLKAEIVRKGDEIEYGIKDNKPYIDFKPVPFNSSEVIGAFAVAYFEDGGLLYEVMNMDELRKIRNASKCGKSGPWATWTEEMYKKSVLLRLSKQIETDFDNVEAHEAWEHGNYDEFTKPVPSEADIVDPFMNKDDETIIDSTVREIDETESTLKEKKE